MNLDKKIATRESYGKTLVELGKENDKVVVLDADLAEATKTSIFAKEFPKRFFDMGIAEQDMIGTSAGLAMSRTNGVCKFICDVCMWKSL
jgi:transketolase